MANILAFDTSSPVLSIALQKGGENISEQTVAGFLKHAEHLLPMMDRMLKRKKLAIHDLDVFLIGRGPGSFTGLRIGLATLKGFLVIDKKTCFGALSLDMIAENVNAPDDAFLAVCMDARREKIYIRTYRRKNGKWLPLENVNALPMKDISLCFPGNIYVTGDALARYRDDFQNLPGKGKIYLLGEDTWYPRASTLLRWYERDRRPLQKLKTADDFLPLYFRLTEAEEKIQHYAAGH